MLPRIPNPAFLIALMIILAVLPTITGKASEPFVGAKSRSATIHADCLDHGQPQLCTRVIEELIADGGPAQILTGVQGNAGGTWNREGVILFARSLHGGLFRILATWRLTRSGYNA